MPRFRFDGYGAPTIAALCQAFPDIAARDDGSFEAPHGVIQLLESKEVRIVAVAEPQAESAPAAAMALPVPARLPGAAAKSTSTAARRPRAALSVPEFIQRFRRGAHLRPGEWPAEFASGAAFAQLASSLNAYWTAGDSLLQAQRALHVEEARVVLQLAQGSRGLAGQPEFMEALAQATVSARAVLEKAGQA